jgi:bla regulator protein BlaR1
MALPQNFIEVVNVVGAVLLHFLWQGAFIGGAYAVARPFFPTMSARYRLGLAALIALALCPVVTLVYLWPEPGVQSASEALPTIGASMLAAADQAVSGWHLHAVLPWLVGAWFVCVAVLATRSFWQWRRLLRIVREASAPSPEWAARLARLCERFGLRRPVRLLCSARAVTPMLIGWIRPVVLLPASMMSGFTTAQVELIIAHELGHICRWDYVANLFQVLIETVLFYHPVVHWISHDVRNARESCCDDLVLHLADGNPLAYARTLADLEELRHDEGLLTPALGASGGVLLARIRHIVGVNDGQERTQRIHFWPAVLVVVALALVVWRQHSTPTLPQPQALTATLANAPAQALAMVSGNPQLAKAPSIAPTAAPVIASREMALPAEQSETVAPVVEKINIDRPRVSVASSRRIDGVRDLIAAASMTASPLLFAEPVASDAIPTSAASTAPLSPLHIVQPIYPPQAMATRIEGKVQLEFSVNADGSVTDIRTVTASPPNVFDAAAQTALRGWRFEPGTSGRHTQNFAFTLHNNSGEKCSQPTGTMICRRPGE